MTALAQLLIDISPLLVWMILFGLRQSWAAILKAIKQFFAAPNILQKIADPFHISAQPRVHQGEDTLGREALQAEPTTAGFIGTLGTLLEFHAFTVKYIARDMLAAVQALGGYAIPHAVTVRTKTTREIAQAANTRSALAWKLAAAALAAGIAALKLIGGAAHQAQVTANKALAKSQAVTLDRPVDVVRDRTTTRTVEKDSALARWLRRFAVGLTAGVFTALGLRILARHLPWYRCSNVNKVGRALCRFPVRWLDALLLGIVDVLLVTDICRLVRLAVRIADEFEPVIRKLVVVENAALCGGDRSPAPQLTIRGVAWPDPTNPIPL